MTALPATNPPAARPDSDLRVVLVGRTGLDAALRLDPRADVRRARTAPEAIGELTDTHAVSDASSIEVAVVLAPGIIDHARIHAFADAARTLSPRARICALDPSAADGFDLVIRPGLTPRDLSRVLRGLAPEPIVQPRRDPPAPSPHTTASPTDSLVGVSGELRASSPEYEMLDAVLTGKDVRTVASAIVSRMLSVPAQVLLPTSDAALAPGTLPIVHSSRVLAHLHAPGAPADALRDAGNFLAPWLKLSLQQDQLRTAAFTDELTGAFNRRYFLRFLSAAIEQAKDRRHALTLLIFDVDNFKHYNDTAGHAAGDEILTQTVRLLTSVIRPTDRVCRIGGDEFAVIFHDPEGPRKPEAAAAGPRSIAQIIERFQKQITEHRFPKLADKAMPTLTISGGMATFPWDGRSVQELMDRADDLAMQSKRQGKNAITFGPGAERACRE